MPSLQSAYHRVNHSTETAVLRVLGDILLALDRGDFAARLGDMLELQPRDKLLEIVGVVV